MKIKSINILNSLCVVIIFLLIAIFINQRTDVISTIKNFHFKRTIYFDVDGKRVIEAFNYLKLKDSSKSHVTYESDDEAVRVDIDLKKDKCESIEIRIKKDDYKGNTFMLSGALLKIPEIEDLTYGDDVFNENSFFDIAYKECEDKGFYLRDFVKGHLMMSDVDVDKVHWMTLNIWFSKRE